MARLFAGEQLWKELRRAARKSRRLDAAVAFIGRNPEAVLKWPAHTTLVADVSALSVAAGRCSARGVRKLKKQGARVKSVAGLHAKVYVFDKVAFVGSPNASENSGTLIEAAIKLSKPSEVEAARALVHQLWRSASPLPDDLLRQLIVKEPERVGWGSIKPTAVKRPAGIGRSQRLAALSADLSRGRSLWLDAVTPADVPAPVERRSARGIGTPAYCPRSAPRRSSRQPLCPGLCAATTAR